MQTNADCTIIRQDGTTTYVPACMWQDVEAIEIKKFGADNADSAAIYIFDMSVVVAKGDSIAKSTETDLHNALTITSVSKKDYSKNGKHIQIGAK